MAEISVLSSTACELGEGPSYDPRTDTLFWFDIVGCRMFEHRLEDGTEIAHRLPRMASAIGFREDGLQVLAMEDGLYLRQPTSGALSLLVPIEAEKPANRSNDSRVHPSGAFWIGTMAKDEGRAAGAIYWYRKGELRRLYAEMSIPNSICFTADGATAYFTDTPRRRIMRVECDPESGLPRGEPAVFVDVRGRDGWVDGSVLDAEGNLWNARWGAGALDQWSPQGRLLRTIGIPAGQSSCPAFIGRHAGAIAVTSAWKGLDDAARAADPQAGQTFRVDLDVRGRFDPPVAP